MTIKIIQKENSVLRQIAKELTLGEITSARTREILVKMARALDIAENGVAIAAPQVGESLRIFLVDGNVWRGEAPVKKVQSGKLKVESSKTETRKKNTDSNGENGKKIQIKYPPIVFINPVIKKISKKIQKVEEGCLSVDGIFGIINRAEKAAVEALDENGKKFSRGCSGLLAQIVQHEVDHLNGVLFIDKAKDLQKITPEKNLN